MKKKLCITFAAVLVFCAGCHGRAPVNDETTQAVQEETEGTQEDSQTEEAPPGQAELTVWLGNNLSSLDPAQAIYSSEKTMIRHEYETLLVRNEEGEADPGQAESWEVSEDGLTVTFHLRDGLKWSDGSSLTASDFVYSWNRLADPTRPSPYAEDLLGGVDGFYEMQEGKAETLSLSAPDARTLVVTLSEPDFSFPEKCTIPAMSPVKEAAVESGSGRWYLSSETSISNGPMVLLEYVADDHVTFVKNENYWNAGQVSLNSITFLLDGSEEENLARYEAGQLDLMLGGVDREKDVMRLASGDEAAPLADGDIEATSGSETTSSAETADSTGTAEAGSTAAAAETDGIEETVAAEDAGETQTSDAPEEAAAAESTAEAAAEESSGTDQFSAPLAASGYVILNTEIEPFQDVNVRRALSLVLDRNYIADVIMEGTADPAWTLIGPGYSDDEEGSSFTEISMAEYFAPKEEASQEQTAESNVDAVLAEEESPAADAAAEGEMLEEAAETVPEETAAEETVAETAGEASGETAGVGSADPLTQAQALLGAAGYPGGQGIPEITYLVNDSGYNMDLAEYLQSAWGELGVSVKIREVTWAYFIPYRDAGDFTAARGTWISDQNDPGEFLSQFTTGARDNDGNYSNAQVDQLLDDAAGADSRSAYYEALHQAEQLILEDGAALPIVFYREEWRQNPKLYGVRHCADGTWIFSDAYYL